jgi:chromosome segregation ATPase
MIEYNYPSYNRIPIDEIRQKQQDYLIRCNLVNIKLQKKHQPLLEIPVRRAEENKSCLLDTAELRDKVEKLKTEMIENEDVIENQQKMIEENSSIIKSQKEHIQQNQRALQDLVHSIAQGIQKINEQISIYNHNNAMLQSNLQQVYQTYSEIGIQQENLYRINAQISQGEARLTELNEQIASYTSEAEYHQSMLEAYNTFLQNPEYFCQLVTASIVSSTMTGGANINK